MKLRSLIIGPRFYEKLKVRFMQSHLEPKEMYHLLVHIKDNIKLYNTNIPGFVMKGNKPFYSMKPKSGDFFLID